MYLLFNYSVLFLAVVWFSENIVPLWEARRCFFVVFHMSISLLIRLFHLSFQLISIEDEHQRKAEKNVNRRASKQVIVIVN